MMQVKLLLLVALFIPALQGAARPVAAWPPVGPVRVIIDADAANEVDDQYALALALGSPERFRIEGLIAAHFGEAGGASGIDKSYAEIQRVLEKAGLSGRYPIKRGADPLQYRDRPPASDGVDFIIERAKTATTRDPLWLVLLGPATDAAAALLRDPSIADRLVIFWHGRTQWPVRAWNFNAYNDILAVRVIFETPCRLVLFDTGTYLRIPKEETERRFAPLGPLGAYLHEIRMSRPAFADPAKGFFDLGDIAAIAGPSAVRWERVAAPAVDRDLRYDFSRDYGEIVRIYHVETEPAFKLLEGALRLLPALSTLPQPKDWTTAEDHRNMMEQLGIKALRPGPSGNEKDPNHANYDESKANPFPNLPEVLTLKNGDKVTTADMWWKQRRPEIVEEFEREVLGRVPQNVPKVTWLVTNTVTATVGSREVIAKQLTGRVDNSSYPLISVDMEMTLVTPAGAPGPVPVMMMFGRGGLPGAPPPPGMPAGFGRGQPGADPPATEQLIADGWGYAYLNPASIQADNGAGLTRGIIGLVNKGQPRKPDDWGSLRAWAWGASRALDYLETDRAVDAKHVGIEGVSRYGKAALVTMAMDTRFAVVLVGSSGEGGAKLHRRNFGEAVENLTGSGEYHWMAGNFMKYGASDALFGSKNAGDIPVDAHQLIALCAPRATFISYGVPEKGDAKWLDQQGSFMAAIAAGPVFRLLGVKDLGRSDDYRTEKMPAVNVSLLDGHLAWRQHDGGHTDGPNWRYFIPWANRLFGREPVSAYLPVARTDPGSLAAHSRLIEKTKQGRIDIYFEGDSITRRWGATDYPELLANWKQNFFGWNAANFGWGADRVQNVLWRLLHGELEGVNPKVIVLLAGTNDVGNKLPPQGGAAVVSDVTRGIRAILDVMHAKAPGATIILIGIFPRNDNMAVMPTIDRINANLAQLADGKRTRFLNINGKLAGAEGVLLEGMAHDKLHLTAKGYQVWADALKPVFTELLGPPGKEDLAPPATGAQ